MTAANGITEIVNEIVRLGADKTVGNTCWQACQVRKITRQCGLLVRGINVETVMVPLSLIRCAGEPFRPEPQRNHSTKQRKQHIQREHPD